MKVIELKAQKYLEKFGQKPKKLEANVVNSSIFIKDDVPVGFYINDLSNYVRNLISIADTELRSSNVPKTKMQRGTKKLAIAKGEDWVEQYSTILGAAVPRAHMRRNYARTTTVHGVKTAQTFIKAMLMLCKAGERIIKHHMPEQYEKQKTLIEKNVPKHLGLTDLFSSSISNYNIAASYHQDRGNLKGCVNVIYSVKKKVIGAHLHVPEYGLVIDNADNSLLVYPAYANMHGVTPITSTNLGGYRNSLVFYTINGLQKFM
tara:strand:+ start:2777 stop:3559 length:783 start_codon:yes stop_codon:yes gene_type:complete